MKFGCLLAMGQVASYFVWLNRSKESVELDVKSEAGREILHELADRADVIVQNFGYPHTLGKLAAARSESRI